MVPDIELDTFVSARERSARLAAEGRLADGYTCLLEGWEKAMATRDNGEEWGADLAFLYLIAMDSYCAVVGVQPEGGRKNLPTLRRPQRHAASKDDTAKDEPSSLHAAWNRERRRHP